jgi:hypothetical protein
MWYLSFGTPAVDVWAGPRRTGDDARWGGGGLRAGLSREESTEKKRQESSYDTCAIDHRGWQVQLSQAQQEAGGEDNDWDEELELPLGEEVGKRAVGHGKQTVSYAQAAADKYHEEEVLLRDDRI